MRWSLSKVPHHPEVLVTRANAPLTERGSMKWLVGKITEGQNLGPLGSLLRRLADHLVAKRAAPVQHVPSVAGASDQACRVEDL
ncbi:hypothetical protein GAR06_03478 [Micromonospora saelicesensis]|nr:hypothetical protein GAR06_03478 [Micromonospora saelicesensis]